MKRAVSTLFLVCVAAFLVRAQDRTTWNQPQEPVRMYGNTYYVGTRGLAAILITSADGHVLIDGALPESVPLITGNIRAAGFRVEDVKLILNSHPHWDHAGGIGELARLSGARVAASAPSARVFETGKSGPDDPQHGVLQPIDPVTRIEVVKDGETLRVGSLALTAHATGGHTPGGTSWSWRSCQDGRCLDMVYADSLTAVSADGFLFTRSRDYPDAIADFEKGFATLSALPCDVLMTPHPDASRLWDRIARRTPGVAADPVIDPGACDRLVEGARKALAARVAREKDGAAVAR